MSLSGDLWVIACNVGYIVNGLDRGHLSLDTTRAVFIFFFLFNVTQTSAFKNMKHYTKGNIIWTIHKNER